MADIGEFPTVIGPDASFKGELTFDKGLRLQGKLEGKISTAGKLHVAKEAKMSADVEAGTIVVEGDVRGTLIAADRIELKSSARYEGDLMASKLVVEEGAIFSGHVSVGPDARKGSNGAGAAGTQQQPQPRVSVSVNPNAAPANRPVEAR